jgi:hypothetical protein
LGKTLLPFTEPGEFYLLSNKGENFSQNSRNVFFKISEPKVKITDSMIQQGGLCPWGAGPCLLCVI